MKIATNEIVGKVRGYLGDCSLDTVASYLGIVLKDLEASLESDFFSISDSLVGKRLLSLLFVLECAANDRTIGPQTLNRILTLPCYKPTGKWPIDVISAIHANLPNETLIDILLEAIATLRKPIDGIPISKGLYNVIHGPKKNLNKHRGSSFDEFLKEQRLFEGVKKTVKKRSANRQKRTRRS